MIFGRTNFSKRSVVFVLAVLFVSGLGYCEDSLKVFWENDSRYFKPNGKSDRHYTNGMELDYVTDEVPAWEFLDYFGGWTFGQAEVKKNFGIIFGQHIYSPDHADKPTERDEKDMKFNGWMYSGFFMQHSDGDRLEHTELSLGAIGPSSQGDNLHESIHDLIGSDEPVGWDDQLDDEFAIDLSWHVREKLDMFGDSDSFDVMAEYGFVAGSVHRHADLGFIFRYGIGLNNMGPASMDMPIVDSSSESCYLYLRLSGRAVEHNRFLTGLEEEPLTGSIQAGIVFNFKGCEIGYSQTFFTHMYKEDKSNESIGALTATFYF